LGAFEKENEMARGIKRKTLLLVAVGLDDITRSLRTLKHQ
jgi:hypothetical protein